MKISVVVPAYNCKKYVGRCLDSLLNQTYHNIEVLVIDDGSTDGTSEICDAYKEQDDRINVIHKANAGVSSARNVGISLCTGDYVLFVDSDDWLEKDACAQIAEEIDGESQIYFFSCNKVLGQKIEQQMNVVSEKTIEGLIADIISCPHYQFYYIRASWGKAFRRSLIQNIHFPENVYIGEDACFLLEAICKAGTIGKMKFCKGHWYNYRIHETSAVRKYKDDLYYQCIEQYCYINTMMINYDLADNRMIKTSLVMLAWDILIDLKSNEKMMSTGERILDCRKWIDKEIEVLKTRDLDFRRLSKTQLVFWIVYQLFGKYIIEILLSVKTQF